MIDLENTEYVDEFASRVVVLVGVPDCASKGFGSSFPSSARTSSLECTHCTLLETMNGTRTLLGLGKNIAVERCFRNRTRLIYFPLCHRHNQNPHLRCWSLQELDKHVGPIMSRNRTVRVFKAIADRHQVIFEDKRLAYITLLPRFESQGSIVLFHERNLSVIGQTSWSFAAFFASARH